MRVTIASSSLGTSIMRKNVILIRHFQFLDNPPEREILLVVGGEGYTLDKKKGSQKTQITDTLAIKKDGGDIYMYTILYRYP